MNKLTSFFWHCSGADVEFLTQCRTEKSKYVGIGATIFFTGVFAALACAYALYTVFDNYFAAIALGLIWGLMIFNLDRYIVSSMRKEGKVAKEFLVAVPRIILAIIISIVIAKPLELKIFDKEIQPELIVMEQEAFARQEQTLRSRFVEAQDSLKEEINSLKTEIGAKAAQRDELRRIAQEEADGTGGSRRRNLGPIYKVKKTNADKAEEELQHLIAQNSERVKVLESMLHKNDSIIYAEVGSMVRNKINGPAARMEALDRIAGKSEAIRMASIFILLLFIAIETAPVFVKLISGKGPYDNLLKVEEHSYATKEIELIAKANAETKGRASILSEHERSFVTEKLDASIKG